MALHRKLSEKEAAGEMGVHRETLAVWRREGKVRYRQAGGRIFYLEEDIEWWFEQSKREPWRTHKQTKAMRAS
jgi:predicted site-specific integrase-resolvase